MIGGNGTGKSTFIDFFKYLNLCIKEPPKDYFPDVRSKLYLNNNKLYNFKKSKITTELLNSQFPLKIFATKLSDFNFNNVVDMFQVLYEIKKLYLNVYKNIINIVMLIDKYFNFKFFDSLVLGNDKIIYNNRNDINKIPSSILRFAFLLTILLKPSEMQDDIIIIDSPELGLHTYAITLFAEIVKQASLQKQIIIATQSPDLLNEFVIDDLIIVERNKDGSHFKRLDAKDFEIWTNEYSLGELWAKNLLGGRP